MSKRNSREAKARRRAERASIPAAPAATIVTEPEPRHEPVVLAAELPARIPRAVRHAVEARGVEYEPGDFGGFARRPLRTCLLSNARLAIRHKRLTYTEGVAWIGTYASHHAWLTDEDGRAIETVYPVLGHRYVGIAIPDREVGRAIRAARNMFTGLLIGRS